MEYRLKRFLKNGVASWLFSILFSIVTITEVILLNLSGLQVTAVDLGLRQLFVFLVSWVLLNQWNLPSK